MGIKERRERERQITRQAILTAALAIAKSDGWSALTIRKVAEQIEYSAPMVYEYFASKEAMLQELAREGFQQLQATMQHAYRATSDSEARLYAVASAYWDFAIANPELYQLMHGSSTTPLDNAVLAQAVLETSATPQMALVAWTQDCGIALRDSWGATELFWCLIHGFVTLHLLRRIAGDDTRIKGLLTHALQSQLLAWKTTKVAV